MSVICNVCGLPNELCICQEIAKEQQRAILSTDRRRYGKIVTKVEGLEDSAGGTVKGRTIELQGDHKKKAAGVLKNNGYNVEVR